MNKIYYNIPRMNFFTDVLLLTSTVVCGLEFEGGIPFHIPESKQFDTELKLERINGSIYSDTFSSLDQIRSLIIITSSISNIEENALCASPFEEIELTSNLRLPKLSNKHFGNCWSLTSLKLIFNEGMEMEETVFSKLKNLLNLQIVAQSVKTLTREYFRNLSSLETLSLVACGIQKIEDGALDYLTNLTTLKIQGNKMGRIDGYFTKLNKLKSLYLDNNNLRKFPWNDLRYWPDLEVLSITYNRISSYEVNKLSRYVPKLKEFSLRYNVFRCRILKSTVMELSEKFQNLTVDYKMKEFDYCVSK